MVQVEKITLTKSSKSLKKYVQRIFRAAYWNYINYLTSPPNEDGKPQGQKRFWSYTKSLKQDYSGVSSLKHDGKKSQKVCSA